jgi:hypothetical protein
VRSLLSVTVFLFASAMAAQGVTFVSRLEGAQALGPAVLEVTTSATAVDRVDFYVDGALAGVARKPPYRIAFDFGTTQAPRTVMAQVWSGGFRTTATATVTTAGMSVNDTLHVDLVEVPVRVRSSKRASLSAADFQVRENGVAQTVRDVRMERPAAHFAFIVDRSLSMDGGKLEAALHAVERGLAQLRPGDTASLVLFNHHVETARQIARGDHLSAGDLTPSGGTSLRDALASAASGERTYAIAITDGGDRNSELSEEEALRKISGTRTIVNAVVLGSSHARFLDRAASNTGGSVVEATARSAGGEVERILADINSRYLLIYQSSATTRGWRSLDVKPRRRGMEILAARKGYFAG